MKTLWKVLCGVVLALCLASSQAEAACVTTTIFAGERVLVCTKCCSGGTCYVDCF